MSYAFYLRCPFFVAHILHLFTSIVISFNFSPFEAKMNITHFQIYEFFRSICCSYSSSSLFHFCILCRSHNYYYYYFRINHNYLSQ